ncbi:lipopolysaccharide assembly protein LapA domain-containing protein [Rugosimonospora acidiphila]|uniref:lipopolysaccharide assembly protein LapA domain-containing protein n=1 Tax=Rugosimonospora acidiphila TaxID=556531 RepID=UPI0031ED641F
MTQPTDQRRASYLNHEVPPVAAVTPTVPLPSRLPRSRAGGLWTVLVAFALVLLFLLIFILQNGQRSDVYLLGAHGHLPMAVALLLATVFGVLLVALPATVRILQLRLTATRARKSANTTREPAGS